MDKFFIGNYYISDGTKPISKKVRMPIEWLVLLEKEGLSLLLSKDVLDWELYAFHEKNSWDESYIYKYLKDLFQTLFTQEEKNAIVNGELGPLFILSKKEVETYLPSTEKRRAVMYFNDIKDDGEVEITINHHSYWLRHEGESGCMDVEIVDALGNFEICDSEADEVGVRVAMWVDTQKARVITAQKGYNPWQHFWDVCEY